MQELIRNLKLEDITPYEKNAKLHPDRQIRQIARSIQEFGFNQPIVTDKNKVIIVGHGRYLAAQSLKMDEVPVLVLNKLTPAKIRAYRLADNKLNESDWDNSLVIAELKELEAEGLDITITGFDKDFMESLFEDDFNAQEEYDKIKTPTTKLGDLFQLGAHRLLCGNAENDLDFQTLMGGVRADLIFTDPPYSVDYQSVAKNSYNKGKYGGGGKILNDNKNDKQALEFYVNVLTNLQKFSKDSAVLYWWFANSKNHINRQAWELTNWKMSQVIIWLKNSPIFSPGQTYHRCYEPCMLGWKNKKSEGHYHNKKIANLRDVFSLDFDQWTEQLDVWYQKRDSTTDYVHPTQKPVRLPERALKKNSRVDDVVIDCFGGSGSTLIACEQAQRKCHMMELDPKYCDVIIKRWEKFAKGKAKKI